MSDYEYEPETSGDSEVDDMLDESRADDESQADNKSQADDM